MFNTSIYHHSLKNIKDFIRKFDFRIRVSLEKGLLLNRSNISSVTRRYKNIYFILCDISFPTLKAIKETYC